MHGCISDHQILLNGKGLLNLFVTKLKWNKMNIMYTVYLLLLDLID